MYKRQKEYSLQSYSNSVLKSEIVKQDGSIAVSYTHLDVYKRQAYNKSTLEQLNVVELNPTFEDYFKDLIAKNPSNVCLLYTSRCV